MFSVSSRFALPQFGAIYAIHGKQPEEGPFHQYSEPVVPPKRKDPNITLLMFKLQNLAAQQNIPMDDFIVTRRGGPYQGEPNITGEVRLVLTEEDAVVFRKIKETATSLIEQLEINDVQMKQKHDLLLHLTQKHQESAQKQPLLKRLFRPEPPGLSPEEQETEALLKTELAELEQKNQRLKAAYREVVQPFLQEARKKYRGYLPVEIVEDRLLHNTFDVRTGGHVQSDKYPFWYYH